LRRQGRGGERLVHVEEIEVRELRLVALEGPADGRDRPDSHERRVAAGDAPAGELADGGEPLALGELPGGEHQRGSAVADAAGRAGVDDAVLLEDLGELR